MAEVLGRPFLYHILDRLARLGITRVVVCTGYMAGQLEAAVGPEYRGMAIAYSREDEPLGTGGALRLALSRHPARLALALNGDSLVEADLAAYLDWFGRQAFEAALLLVAVDDSARFGRVEVEEGVGQGVDGQNVNGSGRVLAFREKGLAGPGLINAGVYLLRPGALSGIQPGTSASIENAVFPQLAQAGTLGGFQVRGRFLDIGTPESYIAAGRFLRGVRPEDGRGAVFLDRDGTVIAERHYLHDPAGVELLPGAAAGLRAILDRLLAGGVIILFPEGTRTHDGRLGPARSGIGLTVIKSTAPVVPVRVFGTYEAYHRRLTIPRPRRVTVKYGHPLLFAELRAEARTCAKPRLKEIYQEVADEIMREIATLGPYRDCAEFP